MVSSRFLEFAWVEAQEVDPVGLLDPSLTLKPVQALLGHPTVFLGICRLWSWLALSLPF